MPASRFPLVSPLDRPPSTLLRTSFDTTFGLLRVRPAANAMPLIPHPTVEITLREPQVSPPGSCEPKNAETRRTSGGAEGYYWRMKAWPRSDRG
jgi:hypothetical protein